MTEQPPEKTGLKTRRAAINLLQGVTLDSKPLDQMLEEEPEFRTLTGRDRSFAHAIAATSLRHGGEISAVIASFLQKPLPPSSGFTVDILQATAAQLLFMKVSPHAAIDSAVTLAKQDRKAQHFSGLINAVLRKVATEGPKRLGTLDGPRLNTPDWLWQAWTADYGEEQAHAIAKANTQEAALDISVKADAPLWAERLKGELLPTHSIRLRNDDVPLTSRPGFAEGAWWVQDAAAALPVRLLGHDLTGQSILDLCAAPGGKTAQLCAAGAHVTAVDDSPSRLQRLRDNLERLRFKAEVHMADVLSLPPTPQYDGILLDAPCSATGTMRRHPDLIYLKTPEQLAGLIALQEKMLAHASQMLKASGTLVYCVCSLSAREGERQVFKFLRAHENFDLVAITPAEVGQQSQFITPAGLLRCLPSMSIGAAQGLDGFFAAKLMKKPG